MAFASGTDELNARLIERMRGVFPELPLYVVSEFPPGETGVHWIRYRGGLRENLARCRSAFRGKSIRLVGVLLVPNVPFRRMRLLALILAPLYFLAVNEHLNDFMLRPGSLPAIVRHFFWRLRNFIRWHLSKDGAIARRGWHDVAYIAALAAGRLRFRRYRDLTREDASLFCTQQDSRIYALYGSPSSTYDSDKLRELGVDSAYATEEVKNLDVCYRAWQRGWPTFASQRRDVTFDPLDHLQFLSRTIASPSVFRAQWARSIKALHEQASPLLWKAPGIALRGGPSIGVGFPEDLFLAMTDGSVAVYPGKAPGGKPRLLVVSAYVPFPLSHGGAVRIYNLTVRAAADWDQILICFTEDDRPPAPELLERFVEVVLVRRTGSHSVPSSNRPEVVEQFASLAFRGALQLAVRKWSPAIAQLEFTQMAQYAADCSPAKTILVEHDITFDLYQQLALTDSDWDLAREVKRWEAFETAAWRQVNCVVTMSAKDQARVEAARSIALPNGVDLDRFRTAAREPEPGRLLFVGSFSHLPNMMALAFFLDEAWPHLAHTRLHIIAGANHEYFLDYQRAKIRLNLDQPAIEVEGFVSDVRSAYERAAIVIAPLVASAGTNLKILEAMACGRPVVSTPAGVNGLDLIAGEEFVLVQTGREMAQAIQKLLASPDERHRLAMTGRRRVEESYGWDSIAQEQNALYRDLL